MVSKMKCFEFNSTCIKHYPQHLQFHVTSSHMFNTQRERERDTHTHRQTDRQTETEREKEGEIQKERGDRQQITTS